jgi:hypothetical protein
MNAYTHHVDETPTDEALVTECFQAGAAWSGSKLPITVVLPSGHPLVVRCSKNEYNTAFVQGWKTRKQLTK